MNGTNLMKLAPELSVSQWFNSDEFITLEKLRGKVVIIEAFQMLCPGCVSHGLPQAQQIAALFPSDKVAVLGLHTVFEHHAAMTPTSLEAFIHEYRLTFPIGVDEAGTGAIPKTIETFKLRGTPSLLMIDQKGILRANYFGQIPDIKIGAEIATLLSEKNNFEISKVGSRDNMSDCDDDGCRV